MIAAPRFWRHGGWPAHLLAPLGGLTAWLTARRLARPGWRAPVPVICCGNASVGGAGKTIVALDLVTRLRARGIDAQCLSRGHGGAHGRRTRGALRVDPALHDAAEVGDEPLLLAATAPAWVARDRAAGAAAAIAAGAGAIVMDDGLQNPDLIKNLALLVIDAEAGFGNGRLLPAGPLRESVARAASRCQAAVLIGDGAAPAGLPAALPVLRARLEQQGVADLRGRAVLAIAGIGRPEKFWASLERAGLVLAGRRGFADHHPWARGELESVLAEATRLGAVPVTTAKDAARMTPSMRARFRVAGVRLVWDDPAAIERLLATVVPVSERQLPLA